MSIEDCLGTVPLVILVGLLSLAYLLKWRPRNFPPGPFAYPIVGNTLQLGPEPHKYFTRMRDKYGDIFSVKIGGFKTAVINGLDNIQEALVTKKNAFAGRPPLVVRHVTPFGLAFFDPDEQWVWMRKQIVRGLGNLITDKSFNLSSILELAQDDLLEEFSKQNGRPFDPFYAQNEALFCAGYEFLYDKDVHLKQMEGKYDLKKIIDSERDFIFFAHVGSLCNVLSWLRWLCPWAYTKALAHNDDLEQLTVEKIDQLSTTYDPAYLRGITDCLLGTSSDTPEIRQKLLFCVPELLTASFDTTATALLWTYLLLVKNEDVQRRVQASIDRAVGQARVTIENRKKLPLVEAVILEAMRVEMPIPTGIPKMALDDCVFKGYSIPKGTVILTNIHSVNYDESLWDSPNEFRPERFLKDDSTLDREKEHNVLAFGTGQRKCPGEAVARAQLFIAVAMFYRGLISRRWKVKVTTWLLYLAERHRRHHSRSLQKRDELRMSFGVRVRNLPFS